MSGCGDNSGVISTMFMYFCALIVPIFDRYVDPIDVSDTDLAIRSLFVAFRQSFQFFSALSRNSSQP